MIYLTKYGIEDLEKKLRAKDKVWEMTTTKNNFYISIGGKGRFYEGATNKGGFSRKELGLINSTKNKLKKYAEHIKEDYTKVDLFTAFNIKSRPYFFNSDCIQIDINSAFLTVLKNVGAIDKELYNSFFELEDIEKMSDNKKEFKVGNPDYKSRCGGIYKNGKKSRLVAVGTVATQKDIKKYKGNDIIGKDFIYNKKEANVFFYAAFKVGQAITEIMKNCNGFFYWVDCVFLPLEMKEKAIEMFKEFGFEFHYNECTISKRYENYKVLFEVTNKDDGEIKEYVFPYSKGLDLNKKLSDPCKIMETYNNIIGQKIKFTDIGERCISLNLLLQDIITIKNKFEILESPELCTKTILLSIVIELEKDITILFPD